MSGPAWTALEEELARWTAAGETATLWWRDDDATAPGAALDRLLALGGGAIPIALAVIPAEAAEALAPRLAAAPHAAVLLHGYGHVNHRPGTAEPAEFGGDRPADIELAEIARGLARLRMLFTDRLVPGFVPPWNRLADSLLPALPQLGLRGLSRFGPRQQAAVPGLIERNVHVDPIDWRHGWRFTGEAAALGGLVRHLAQRRTGRINRSEPTGLLTHHRAHRPELWRFLERLAARLVRHPAVRWLAAAELFPG